MHRDFATAEKPPVCPVCGRDMKVARLSVEQGYMNFAQLTVEQGREVGLNTFECGPCRISYTTAADEHGLPKKS